MKIGHFRLKLLFGRIEDGTISESITKCRCLLVMMPRSWPRHSPGKHHLSMAPMHQPCIQCRAKERELSLGREVPSRPIGCAWAALS